MLFTAENILLVGSILLFVSIIVGKTGYRFGVPALLLFLVVGMLFGSDGLGLQFHNAKEAQFIGMVAFKYHPVFGRYGHQVHRNQAHSLSRYRIVHFRRTADGIVYRIIHMVAVGHELDQYSSAAHHIPVARFYHVVHGLGVGVRYPALAKDEFETQPAAYAGVGKR